MEGRGREEGSVEGKERELRRREMDAGEEKTAEVELQHPAVAVNMALYNCKLGTDFDW